jgi:hypothetical protein
MLQGGISRPSALSGSGSGRRRSGSDRSVRLGRRNRCGRRCADGWRYRPAVAGAKGATVSQAALAALAGTRPDAGTGLAGGASRRRWQRLDRDCRRAVEREERLRAIVGAFQMQSAPAVRALEGGRVGEACLARPVENSEALVIAEVLSSAHALVHGEVAIDLQRAVLQPLLLEFRA